MSQNQQSLMSCLVPTLAGVLRVLQNPKFVNLVCRLKFRRFSGIIIFLWKTWGLFRRVKRNLTNKKSERLPCQDHQTDETEASTRRLLLNETFEKGLYPVSRLQTLVKDWLGHGILSVKFLILKFPCFVGNF